MMIWRNEQGIQSCPRPLRSPTAPYRLILGGLVLALLTLAACQQASSPLAPQSISSPPTRSSQQSTPTVISNPEQTSQRTPSTPTNRSVQKSQKPTSPALKKPASTNQEITPSPTRISPQRNHIPAGTSPLFARITFTPATTYDQAVALITSTGYAPYPWDCDEPRTPTPPPPARLQMAFASSHQLLVSYPSDHFLNQLASSPQVVSVDAAPVYPCP